MSPTPAKDSSTPSVSASVQIVGDKINGYVVLDTVAKTVRKFDLKSNSLGAPRALPSLIQATVTPATTTSGGQAGSAEPAAAPAMSQGIAGNGTTGVVYFIGNQMAYLIDIGNPMSLWKTVREIPFSPGTNIKGICGDLVNGIVAHNGDLLALASNLQAYPIWQSNAISPRLPIRSISGDCTNGIMVYCDASQALTEYEDENKLLPSTYQYSGKTYGAATPLMEPPIVIDLLFGNFTSGYMAFGENQLYIFDQTKNWVKKASLSFGLNGAAGNAKDGLLALVGTENFIVNTTDFITWTLQQPGGSAPAPDASGTASSRTSVGGASGHVVIDGASDTANALASSNAAQSAFTTNT